VRRFGPPRILTKLTILVGCASGYHSQSTTIDVIPDDVLLKIFDYYRSGEFPWKWHTLVHVCQRWRCLVFSSLNRLHVRLFCTDGTPVKEFLGIWPALPIVIRYGGPSKLTSLEDEENLVIALRQPDRIHEIGLTTTVSLGRRVVAEMRKTMPLLKSLVLAARNDDGEIPVHLPVDFLGGSAPVLSRLFLDGVAFRALPKFLLSTTNLASLELMHFHRSGYFSPEAIVEALSAMTQLKTLKMHLDFHVFHFDASTLPTERTVLPALVNFDYHGYIEYFENFMARIDTPLIEIIELNFYNWDVIEFPQFCHFIRRTRQLGSPTRAEIQSAHSAGFILFYQPATTGTTASPGKLCLKLIMACTESERHLSLISQLSLQLWPFFSDVRQLNVLMLDRPQKGDDNLVRMAEVLRRFSRIEILCVMFDEVSAIAQVLRQAASETDPGFLPALHELCLGDPRQFFDEINTIKPFIEARRLSRYPVKTYYVDQFLEDESGVSRSIELEENLIFYCTEVLC